MSINLGFLPSCLAEKQNNHQLLITKRLHHQINDRNKLLHERLHPLLYELSSILDPSNEQSQYDLSELLKEFDLNEIDELYQEYRKEIVGKSVKTGIENGAIHELFPENLTEVSPHQLRKIEFQIKNWIENYKNFNNKDMQELYFFMQMGVVLLSCFQHIQKEANQANEYIVRNQKG